jgi:hypothetical protein
MKGKYRGILQLFLCGTHRIYIFFFSSTEHCAWVIISPKEFKSCVTCISFALLYWNTELSAVKYLMHVTQDLNSFGEIITHAQCSVDEHIYIHVYIFRVYHIRIIVEICSQQLEICKSVCMFIVLAIVVETD